MAMEINGFSPDYIREYPEVNKTDKSENDTSVNKIPQDEYISSEKAGNRPSGLYGLSQDENGNRKIVYDDPHKKDRAASDGVKPADGDDKEEKCTTNTDSVDKEIEKLKEEKKQIEQQIRSANGDEEKKKELERKLEQIENELSQKDTDSYRRQNAVINDEG
jgi:ABC-type phosphate transport system auxiliary subunit